jgi:hypothetical protein
MKLKSYCPVPCRDLLCVSSFRLGLRFKMNADSRGRIALSESDSTVDVRHGVGATAPKRKEAA